MIRTVWVCNELAAIMSNGQATCDSAMNALNTYFQQYVYKRYGDQFIHPQATDDHVISIMRTAIETDDPHLKGTFKVLVLREHPDDVIADLQVMMDDVYVHLVDVQQGAYLWH